MSGEVSVLSVGEGDITLSFNSENPAEVIRASRIVQDMLKRGYALLVHLPDGGYRRVQEFDANTCEYIIADFDSSVVPPETAEETLSGETNESQQPSAPAASKRAVVKRRIAAAVTNVVAVARTAGG